jgi:hypothetical protein
MRMPRGSFGSSCGACADRLELRVTGRVLDQPSGDYLEAVFVAESSAHRQHPPVVRDEHISSASDMRRDVLAILLVGFGSRPVPVCFHRGPSLGESIHRLLREEIGTRKGDGRRHGQLPELDDAVAL